MIKKFTVNVTQRDIKYGEKHRCQECPIARAMQRLKVFATTYIFGVSSNYFYYSFKKRQELTRTSLPSIANRFIEDYDFGIWNGSKIKPFKFQIEVEIGD